MVTVSTYSFRDFTKSDLIVPNSVELKSGLSKVSLIFNYLNSPCQRHGSPPAEPFDGGIVFTHFYGYCIDFRENIF